MPRETVYGDEQVALDSEGNEWPLKEIPPGVDVKYIQRGVQVNWVRDADLVEIGVAMIETATGEHLRENDPVTGRLNTGAFTRVDQQSLARLIRMLKRAGRQAFGESPW